MQWVYEACWSRERKHLFPHELGEPARFDGVLQQIGSQERVRLRLLGNTQSRRVYTETGLLWLPGPWRWILMCTEAQTAAGVFRGAEAHLRAVRRRTWTLDQMLASMKRKLIWLSTN